MATAFPEFPWALTIGGVFAALCLGGAFGAARRKRLVENIPTSKTTGVFIGLVETVIGLRDYERTVQTELAQIRAELVTTAPGLVGPDPAACGTTIAAIVERYPELVSNGAFTALAKETTATEDRIALARGYFNDIATFYNTRLETLPERFVAGIGGLRRQSLMDVRGFERKAAPIHLVSQETSLMPTSTSASMSSHTEPRPLLPSP